MNRMDEKWLGITYPGSWLLCNRLMLWLWKKLMCKRGYHLFDEVQSIDDHYLSCDACHMEIHIDRLSMILKSARATVNWVKENLFTPIPELVEQLKPYIGNKSSKQLYDAIQIVKMDLPHNPIHQKQDGWYFWDEVWAFEHGPWASEQRCITELISYGKTI